MKTARRGARRRGGIFGLMLFALGGLPVFGEGSPEAAPLAAPATKTGSIAEPALLPYHAISSMLERLAAPGSPRSLRIVIEVGVFRPEAGQGGGEGLYESEKRRAMEILGSKLGGDSGLSLSGVDRRDFPLRSDLAPQASLLPTSAAAAGSGTSQGGLKRPASVDTQALLADDDKAILKAGRGEWLLLVVRIVDYRSGRYDLLETTARLLDRQTGRELARDVAWTSMVDGVTKADFIDGSRAK